MNDMAIPRVASIKGVDSIRGKFHQGALNLLAAYERERRPFALFLRTFHALELEIGYQRPLENDIRASLWKRLQLNVITVQINNPSVDYECSPPGLNPRRRWLPALILDEQFWLEGVRHVLERADIIVSELALETPGAMAELKACHEGGHADRTIVVLPQALSPAVEMRPEGGIVYLPPQITPTQVGSEFLRTIFTNNLDLEDPLGAFVFRDLVQRMAAIAHLHVKKRIALHKADKINDTFPVTFSGVAKGYDKLARECLALGWPSLAAEFSERAARITQRSMDENKRSGLLPRSNQARLPASEAKATANGFCNPAERSAGTSVSLEPDRTSRDSGRRRRSRNGMRGRSKYTA
jgi:hypothetical protein